MTKESDAAEALLDMDEATRDAMAPIRHHTAIEAIGLASDIADQWPLRIISGGVLVAGLVRQDRRLIRAGARMLIAHELATLTKNAVKRRVDRSRPRSASGRDGHRPRPGRQTHKEETSFPSGHSAGAMAVATAFAAELPEHRAPALIAAGAVAAAQIPRCAHYPTDVGAGMAIGIGANWIAGGLMRIIATVAGLLPARPNRVGRDREPQAQADAIT